MQSLQRLVRVRKVRLEQAQVRLQDIEQRAHDADRQVRETEALRDEYGLDRLGPAAAIERALRQRRFAGAVNELLQNRRQQAERIAMERQRRQLQMAAARNQLLVAEKLTAAREDAQRREEARKLRRRSIHRRPDSGRLAQPAEPD